ncbi:MAG: hypothetical protein M0Z45_01265 [Actinomycetota bacterium]|nr:hypothetical protein [Actinomycetota bacterium]
MVDFGMLSFRLMRSLSIFALLSLVLASCGSSETNAVTDRPTNKVLVGKVTNSYESKISVGAPVSVTQPSSPNLNLHGAEVITKDGAIFASQFDGATSHVYVRPAPKDNFSDLSSINGEIIQLQFPSQSNGFALVLNQNSNSPNSTTLYSSSDGGKSWGVVSTGSIAQIHFFNPTDGVALTSVASTTPNQPPRYAIVTTTNGGSSWNVAQVLGVSDPFIPSLNSSSFSFPSPNVGFLAIAMEPGAGSEGKTLLATQDGGASWKVVADTNTAVTNSSATNSSGLSIAGYLEEIIFTSPTTGYLVVERGPRGAVYMSTNGGVSWSAKQILSASVNPSPSISAYRPDTSAGPLLITNYGAIWSANNAGNWNQIFPSFWPSQLSFSGNELSVLTLNGRIFVLPTTNAMSPVAGVKPPSNLNYFKSFSNGDVAVSAKDIWLKIKSSPWKRVTISKSGQVLFADFASLENGILVTTGKRYSIVATSDGGVNWQEISVPFMPLSVDMISSNDWWVIGAVQGPLLNNPYKKNVRVSTYSLYHTTNGGRTWESFHASSWSSPTPIGVKFQSALVGYVWTGQQLLVTLDGGKSFESRALPDGFQITSDHGLAPLGGTSAVVTDGFLPLFKTSDNGATFSSFY